MLTSISFKNGQIFARLLGADAASGDVLLGEASDEEIRDYANENWACPYEAEGACYGDYSAVPIVWIS